MAGWKRSGQKRSQKVRKRKQKQQRSEGQAVSIDRRRSVADAAELFYEAMECTSRIRALEMLERVVQLDPGHLDAWVEIAEAESDCEKAIAILQDAIRRGEKSLRDDLQHSRGHFWGLLHTRPYMRVRYALAEIYFETGELEKAAREMEDMLELNPCDNQGVRWQLLEVYCRMDALNDAKALIERYPEEGVPFLPFTGVLIRFRQEGDSAELRDQLRKNAERNIHIIPRLLNPQLINVHEAMMFSPGSADEADLYCRQFLSVWKSTAGAISWLRRVSGELQLEATEEPEVDYKKEIQRLRNRVKKLPACDENWVVQVTTIHGDEDGEDGWLLNVVDARNESFLAAGPGEDPLNTDTLLFGLLHAMLDPEEGEPRRPTEMCFLDPQWYKSLQPRLNRLDIEPRVTDERPAILEFISKGAAALMGEAPVGQEQLRVLPKESSEWVVSWREMPIWVPSDSGEVAQPWMTMVLAAESGFVLAQQMGLETPDEALLRTVIGQAAMNNMLGNPHRPACIRVPTADHRAGLLNVAKELEIPVRVRDCPEADEAFESLAAHLTQSNLGPPSLMEVEHAVPEMIGDFYEAASDYYKSKVWMKTLPDTIVEVQCPELIHGPWYAVVMGQLGQELGIIFFDTIEAVQSVMGHNPDDLDGGANEMHGLAFSMDEQQQVSTTDAAAAEQFGWPVAAPEAWPTAYFVSDGEMRSLTDSELRFLPAAIRAVTERLSSDGPCGETTVELFDRSVTVITRLSD